MSKKKKVADSCIQLHQFMMPEHANIQGTVHGGYVMKLVDEAGALAAMRHAQRPVVTVAIDSVMFHSPVHVGELMHLTAHLNRAGRTSMEAEIRVVAENPITGERTHTNSAFAVYVALDDNERPVEVPQLVLESADELRRCQEAEARQAHRLQQRKLVQK